MILLIKKKYLFENVILVGFEIEIKFGKGDNIKINILYMYLREKVRENDKICSYINCK